VPGRKGLRPARREASWRHRAGHRTWETMCIGPCCSAPTKKWSVDDDGADSWRRGRHRCGRDRARIRCSVAPWGRPAIRLPSACPNGESARAAWCGRSGGMVTVRRGAHQGFAGLKPATASRHSRDRTGTRRRIEPGAVALRVEREVRGSGNGASKARARTTWKMSPEADYHSPAPNIGQGMT